MHDLNGVIQQSETVKHKKNSKLGDSVPECAFAADSVPECTFAGNSEKWNLQGSKFQLFLLKQISKVSQRNLSLAGEFFWLSQFIECDSTVSHGPQATYL